VATGTLIAESVVVGGRLEGLDVTLRGIERVEPQDISPEQQAAGVPPRWTLLRLELPDAAAPALAHALAGVIVERGWYADLRTAEETFVVIAGHVFRYPIGERAGRVAAEAFARQHGVPEAQLDWP
jgi:non-ribosomal peptide synthetase component F